MVLWLSMCHIAPALLYGRKHDVMLKTAKAKTNCNCTLDTDKVTDRFDSDDVAVTFTVTIESSPNSTSASGDNRRFVLVRKMRAKFLLALPDDSEILSLTTLQHSVRTSRIKMHSANGSNCFQDLKPICQNMVIVAAFYNSLDSLATSGQPICFPPLQRKNKTQIDGIVHQCCSWRKSLNNGFVNCTEVIYPIKWVLNAIIAVQVGSAILFIMTPLLFKYLPTRDTQMVRRSKSTGPKRLGYSNYLATPVDSVVINRKLLTLVEPLSFVTCGADEAQACFSRLCRVIALLIFPLIFCVFVLVFFLSNNDTKIRANISYYTGLVGFIKQPVEYYLFAIVLSCILLLGILVLIPGRLSGLGKALSGRKDERSFLGFTKPDQFINHRSGKAGFQFMQSNMVFHLKCCFDVGFWLFVLKIIFAPCGWLLFSCIHPATNDSLEESDDNEEYQPPKLCLILGFIFLPVIMALWIPFVLFCVVVYVSPTGYVAFRICRLLYSQDIPVKCDCCERIPFCIRLVIVSFLYCMFILFCTCVLASYVFMMLMFIVFFYILGKIFLYTLIGLIFNVNYFIPYTVAAFFVVVYFWRAFFLYFSVYENLRIVLFEECEKYEQQETMNIEPNSGPDGSNTSVSSHNTGLLLLDDNNRPSIPLGLYIAVYRRLRPRGKTFFTILIKFLLTLLYLFIAFAGIMALDASLDSSTYVQAVFIAVTFAFPMVLSHGSSSNDKQRSKDLEYQVRFIIHRYVSKLESNDVTADDPAAKSPENVEFTQPNNDIYEI